MRLLETWVETPLAQAVGWTLLHSLWEAAIVSAALAAVLIATRSARNRYAAGCLAMILMLGGFGLTLLRFMPQGTYGLRSVRTPAVFAWSVPADIDASRHAYPGLAAIVPWLAPTWIAGGWIFTLRFVTRLQFFK